MQIGTRLTLGALCLMLVAVPLIYTTGIYEYSLMPKRLALHACISLALLGWLIQTGFSRHLRLASSPLLLPLFCFMGIALLSTPGTTHPLDSLVELTGQAALIGLVLVTANALPSKRLNTLLRANAAAGLTVALIGILQYHNLAFTGLPTNGHPSATFGYRNFAAMYLICAIPPTVLLFLTASSRPTLLLSAISTTLMGVYLVYTRTRGAWLGLTVALILVGITVLLHPRLRTSFLDAVRAESNRWKKLLLPGSAVLFILLALLPARFRDTGLQRFDEKKANVVSTVISIAGETGDRGRRAMWTNTLRLIADHPLLGVGPGGWKRVYPYYDHGVMIRPDSAPKRPHNDYLWIASEHGLLGLGIYIWLLVAAFRSLFILARRPEGFWRIAAPLFAVSLLATLGHAAFSFPREQPQAAMFPYLLLGLIAGATPTHRATRSPRPFGPLLLGLLLAIALGATELSRRQIGFDRHYLQALWAEDRSDWSAILSEVEKALSYGLFRPHILVIQSRAEEKQRRYPDAETTYHRALDYAPFSWHAHNGLGIIYKRQGQFEKSLAHYREALTIFPSSTQVRNNLGALYKSMGDTARAEQEYRAVLRAYPNDPGANNNLGNIYKARGDLDSAMVAYRKALKSDPNLAQAHHNLADLYRRKRRLQEAVTHYRTAARLAPDEPKTYWGLGNALETWGDVPGAEAAYRKAIALRHRFAEVYFDLGNFLFGHHRYQHARDAYRAFLNLWKGEPRFTRFASNRLAECEKRLKKQKLEPRSQNPE